MENLVSIIIPTFNRASIISETLDSVLDQTYQAWECIVVDDRSNDATPELVQAYSQKDERIKFYSRPEAKVKGASSCRNYGLELSKGIYIQFLDSDDILSKEKIENQVRLLDSDNHYSFSTCQWGTFDVNIAQAKIHKNLAAYQNFDKPKDFIEAMGLSICYFPPHAYLIRKEIIAKAGYWNEYLSLNDDSEFMIRVIINSDKICFSEESFAYYRLPGDDNLSSFSSERRVSDAIYSWELIENYLKIRFKKEEFRFIDRAKNDFYQHARVFPHLIRKHKEFFKAQMKRKSTLLKRLLGSS